jgi:hypothetical protein
MPSALGASTDLAVKVGNLVFRNSATDTFTETLRAAMDRRLFTVRASIAPKIHRPSSPWMISRSNRWNPGDRHRRHFWSGAGGFDQVNVTNLAALNGQLKIELLDNFVPSVGDRMPFLAFGSVSGDFTTFRGLDIGNGLYFQPELDATAKKYELVVKQLPNGVAVQADTPEVTDAFLALVAGKSAGPVDLGAGFRFNLFGVEIAAGSTPRLRKPAGGDPITTIRADDVSLSFNGGGGEVVHITGSGSMILTEDGLAGVLNVAATLSAANADLAAGARGSMTFLINSTGAAVDEAVTVGDRVVVFDLPAGPFLRVMARDVELSLTTDDGQFAITGNFASSVSQRARCMWRSAQPD